MRVLVTGSSGQLGQALQAIAPGYDKLTFHFADSVDGDICDTGKLERLFKTFKPDFCINAAAYTAVDKAESEPDKTYNVNVSGVANVAFACKEYNVTLLHISTDFVFDGTKTTPYTEEDITNPQSVYGHTKRDGELKVQEILNKYYIIRTSWVYSDFGANFMKTMLRIAKERTSINVVDDQTGTPTHALDLAKALLHIILSNKEEYGIYNFSNEGMVTWYGFAREIFKFNNVQIDLHPIPTSAYPTPAKRPVYSVLSKNKIKQVFELEIRDWDEALKQP